jgi:hypothetical protein
MLTKDGKTAEEVAVEERADESFLVFLRACVHRPKTSATLNHIQSSASVSSEGVGRLRVDITQEESKVLRQLFGNGTNATKVLEDSDFEEEEEGEEVAAARPAGRAGVEEEEEVVEEAEENDDSDAEYVEVSSISSDDCISSDEGVFREEDEDEDEEETEADEKKNAMKTLVSMGFPRTPQTEKMLEDSGNNLEIVINRLLLSEHQNAQSAEKTSSEEKPGVEHFVGAVGVRERRDEAIQRDGAANTHSASCLPASVEVSMQEF